MPKKLSAGVKKSSDTLDPDSRANGSALAEVLDCGVFWRVPEGPGGLFRLKLQHDPSETVVGPLEGLSIASSHEETTAVLLDDRVHGVTVTSVFVWVCNLSLYKKVVGDCC